MIRARQQQPPAAADGLALLSCCKGRRLLALALAVDLRWLPATQRQLCTKDSCIVLL